MPKLNTQKKRIVVDTKAGCQSFNRLDMQVSQTMHMAIELYPTLDYLFVLDYYDDITLLDSDSFPTSVSYYQMKTNEDSISISTAISESWLAKLYEHIKSPEWIVNELGLITNCPLKITTVTKGVDGKNHRSEKLYTAEKTKVTSFNSITIDKIREDIATKLAISSNEVDLSGFVHMRTTLSIPKHREIVEQEMNDFLYKHHPHITVDVAKTVFYAMMDLLTRRQEYELLDNNASFPTIREKKGVSRKDFKRVIDSTLIIAIPPFQEIQETMIFSDEDKYKASYEYTKIWADSQSKSESFTALFMKVRELCLGNLKNAQETMQEYAYRICNLITTSSPIYGNNYIYVLIACIQINEWRRAL